MTTNQPVNEPVLTLPNYTFEEVAKEFYGEFLSYDRRAGYFKESPDYILRAPETLRMMLRESNAFTDIYLKEQSTQARAHLSHKIKSLDKKMIALLFKNEEDEE